MGQKSGFAKVNLDHLGCRHNAETSVFTPFSACADAFWRTETPKILRKRNKDGSKMGPKSILPKSYCRPFAVLKEVFSAHGEPLYDAFWPTENPKMP